MSSTRREPRPERKSTESVPLKMPERDDAPPAEMTGQGGVLVIDSDDTEREATAAVLRELGWRVASARDIRSAVELAIAEQPQVIVTELLLPDARGYHFARTLRSVVEHDIWLVGMTVEPALHADEALAAGFDHVVAKPVDGVAIQQLVMQEP